jgi:hypothetical protein
MRLSKQLLTGTILILSSIFADAQNVGIANSSPNNLLEIGVAPNFIGNHLAIGNGTQAMSFYQSPTITNWYSNTAFSLMGVLGGTGYVGIGTQSPTNKLQIGTVSPGYIGNDIAFGNGTQYSAITQAAGNAYWASNTSISLMPGNGYVGIGIATPTNRLQIGSYTNANYVGNQFAYGVGTSVTAMNQFASVSNFQTNTALNIQSANDIYLMPKNGNGNVGINTNAPSYPLEINANVASYGTYDALAAEYSVSFLGAVPSPRSIGVTSVNGIAVFVNGAVVANSYYAVSDARIKNIIGETNTKNDLAIIDKISITDYTMKDKKVYGNKNFKKVIAQQLEEVYPQAVNKQVNFIPNTYLPVVKITKNDGSYALHFNNKHNISKNAKVIKIYSQKGDAKLPVLDVLSDFDVVVKAENLGGNIFVYGEQVNDFRSVDYEGLTTLNISATQELSKQLKQQRADLDSQAELIKQQKEQIAELIKTVKALKEK